LTVALTLTPKQRGKGNAVDQVASRASRKAAWHLIPFLILCWIVAFLDRVNIGFAALTMNKELGLTDLVEHLLGGGATDVGLRTRAETSGRHHTHLDDMFGPRRGQGLGIRVGGSVTT
jgi:hypothetical protein